MSKRGPVVGNWYQDAAEDEIFEVIAVDDDGIAVQYLNGDISEIDPETWAQMVLLPAEPPDDLNELEELMLGEDEEALRRPLGKTRSMTTATPTATPMTTNTELRLRRILSRINRIATGPAACAHAAGSPLPLPPRYPPG